MEACSNKHIAVVHLLLNAGARTDIEDNQGHTADFYGLTNCIDEYNRICSKQNESLEIINQSIEFIELSSRTINCLKSKNINTVRDLIQMTEKDLKMIENFSLKSLDEIKEKLSESNLALGMKI